MRLCSIDGCDEKHEAKDYCKKHYRRFKKYGDPLATPVKEITIESKLVNGEAHKRCNDCKEWFLLNENNFYKVKNMKDGFANYCKECWKQRSRKYSEKPEVKYKRKLYHARWTIQNRDREAENKRRLRRKNPKHYKEYLREYQSLNATKLQTYARKRIMNKRFIITKNEWDICRQYFDYSCAYCGMSEGDHKQLYKTRLHQEHVINYGRNNLTNCVPSCKNCNSQKSEYSLHTWYNENNPVYSKNRYKKIYEWIRFDSKKNLERKKKNKKNKIA